MDCQSADSAHSSTAPSRIRGTRNKNRNPRPCRHCSDSQVRCNISPPYSSHLCQRCDKAGLRECPPYAPRTNGRRREHRPAPYVRPTPPSRSAGPNDNPVYAHESNDTVRTNGQSHVITDNTRNTRNVWDFVHLGPYIPTEAPSYSRATPTFEFLANNASTTIFGPRQSTSNVIHESVPQMKHPPTTLRPGYSNADASGFSSLDGAMFGTP
ncbi:hypothetical protein BD410DRAFT_167005 [Rickenella mellea]|uniref:Zn(2)-C6 fungal-type domain-containing protein n=1 Tax=Rickenella mellea TaxID=50990 RepID=A0A4Y7PK58_9AGAM|nr:hypothetical protein BD410DRAFT_167005 [Rickenella mellea]